MAELADSLTVSTDDRLDQAEALVRAYCGWHIAPSRTQTVTIPAWWVQSLNLPSLYVTAVSAVTDIEAVEVAATDYEWSQNGVISSLVGYWTVRNLLVTFTHGYADPPPEVAAVVQAVAQRAVNNPGSLVRTQAGPFADTYSQTGFNQSIPLVLLDAEKAILDRYRIPPRP